MSNGDNEKMTLTITSETAEWLRDEYPEALDDTEAVRMALQDARDMREAAEVVAEIPEKSTHQRED